MTDMLSAIDVIIIYSGYSFPRMRACAQIRAFVGEEKPRCGGWQR